MVATPQQPPGDNRPGGIAIHLVSSRTRQDDELSGNRTRQPKVSQIREPVWRPRAGSRPAFHRTCGTRIVAAPTLQRSTSLIGCPA